MSEDRAPAADEGFRCRFSPAGCPSPHERDLLAYARAMDFTLRRVRLLAEGAAVIPATSVLEALNEPYRFPLPGDAEELAAYRKVFDHGRRTVLHLAGCDRCNPVGYDHEYCARYGEAVSADAEEAHRVHGGWPPWGHDAQV